MHGAEWLEAHLRNPAAGAATVDNTIEIRLRIYPGFKGQIIPTSRAHAQSVLKSH